MIVEQKKWLQPYQQDGKQYVIHYAPQKMANGKFASKLLIAEHLGSEVRECPVGIKDNLEFNDEHEAAQLGLKAGLEWIRDHS